MKQMHITETVLRDAQQSLIATRMPFEDFEGILDEMDQAGYHSIECWGGATFDSCLRYLHEDPWERLRKIKSHMKNTKLQMLHRDRCGRMPQGRRPCTGLYLLYAESDPQSGDVRFTRQADRSHGLQLAVH